MFTLKNLARKELMEISLKFVLEHPVDNKYRSLSLAGGKPRISRTTWKYFLHHWPFMRGNHQLSLDSSKTEPVILSIEKFFVVSLNKLLAKQLSRQVFEMPWCSCDITVMYWFHAVIGKENST